MLKIFSIVILALVNLSCTPEFESNVVKSPDNKLKVEIYNQDGTLYYKLYESNEVLVDESEISVFPNKNYTVTSFNTTSNSSSWKPVWGEFSEIKDEFNEAIINIKSEESDIKLICRVYDDGIGIRFEIPNSKDLVGENVQYFCEFNVLKQSKIFYPNGEYEPVGPITLSEAIDSLNRTYPANPDVKILKDSLNESYISVFNNFDQFYRPAIPILVENNEKSYLAILESDLYSAVDFNTMMVAGDKESQNLFSKDHAEISSESFITPWRVILVGSTPGELVESQTILNLAAECKLEDTDWIKSGKAMWDWRVRDFVAPDGFHYTTNTETQKRFVDFASDNNILHHLLDWEMFHMVNGELDVFADLDLAELFNYADKLDVGIALYTDPRHNINTTDEQVYKKYSELGATLVKHGFKGNNAFWTRRAIDLAAKYNLMILMHDRPCPMIGVERTMPNAVTREYCHAQQDRKTAFGPTSFLKMAMINAITGPLDQTNGVYDLNAINKSPRRASPRKTETLNTTVVSETARTLIIHSGMVIIPDAPEAYNAKSDLFEFIREMPNGGWDETKIINSKIPEYITTARRKGKEWFIGSANNEIKRSLEIPLDFLEDELNYTATIYKDAPDAHYIENREAYDIEKIEVNSSNIIQADMAEGGGHCIWIRPLK